MEWVEPQNDRTESILVYTHESIYDLITLKGTQSWVLDSKRVSKAKYCLCVKNMKHPLSTQEEYNWQYNGNKSFKPNVEHGNAFYIGRISNVIKPIGAFDKKSEEIFSKRWCIEFSEVCPINIHSWNEEKNPIRYWDTYELQVKLGINFDKLDFLPSQPRNEHDLLNVVKSQMQYDNEYNATSKSHSLNLTIEEAKIGLSNKFGVSVDNIEINIKG